MNPLGIRNGWGRVWRDWKGEQVKEKSRRVLLCLPPPCPSLLPLPHPCITSPRGVEQLLLMGGQVFSLFFLSASGCTTDSHYPGDLLPPRTLSAFRTHGKHKHTYEHTSAAQHLNPLHSLLPLIFLCGALCRRRAWARWRRTRENKAKGGKKKKKDGEKRTEVMVVEEVVRGGDEWERKRGGAKELMFTSRWECRLLLLADRCSVSVCVPQLDLEVVPSCAWRQQRGDVAETLIRRA